MDIRSIGTLGLALSLAACGGGGYGGQKPPAPPAPQEPMEATGVLQAGGVAGVAYATETRQGKTDAAGTFAYLPGEMVTFSIGNVVLGTVTAAAVITPFTLAGATPPTTEPALRTALDRASREASAFSRAINIERLLIALDRDHDPANGISVGDQAAGLAAGELDFDLTVAQFASQLRRRVPDLTGNLPNSQPLVFLYRAMAMQVPVHAEERVVTTLPQYTPIVTQTSYTNGALAALRVDLDGDQATDLESTWQYDMLSRVVAQSMQTVTIAGQPPASLQVANHYDAGGNLLDSDEQHDGDGTGEHLLRLRRTLTNDDHGFAVADVADSDNGADGTIDSRRSTSFTFDARHNVTQMTEELDFGVDAVANERHTVEASYDTSDRQLELTARTDHDADGRFESSIHEIFEYGGAAPGATRHVQVHDFNEDGVADSRTVTTSSHDDAGFLLTELNEYDADADGTPELVARTTFTYDAQHRILQQDDRVDHDVDGEFEELNRVTHTYDAMGNPLTVLSEFDIVDGVAGFTSRVTNQYGASGERLQSTTESHLRDATEFTLINDAVFEHTVIADGVQRLAQQYIDGLRAP
ncbi:MAG TPA: hypothetical protein VFP37_01740 [Steroidobacteraceae bacterium]|nr:hypothetical protein [Steroidobacteraceae bacterium]